MMAHWHFNCNDCGAHGDANGPDGEEIILKIAEMHAEREDHEVKAWPRGDKKGRVIIRKIHGFYDPVTMGRQV